MNWMETMVASYKELVLSGIEIYGDANKAILYANENSCAGNKVKQIALQELGI